MNVLVLITGTGRSGTSTMSGALHHLGLHVPGPYLGANESNPKGFFESRWSVRFHKQLAALARIHEFDSRPGALERVQDVITDDHRKRLVEFLGEHAADHRQVVVKDPRSVWTQQLWREAAAEVGLEIRYVSMLRHPAEVVGSRTANYASPDDELKRRRYETFNVARWINNSVISEQQTRGHVRSFVYYTDLLADWRPVLARVGTELGLDYNTDLSSRDHHPVDDFIDPGLRRHQVTWDELDVPAELQVVAERIWTDLTELAARGGADPAISADIDEQAEHYARIFTQAAAISHDATEEAKDDARRAGAAAAREGAEKSPGQSPGRPAGRLVEEIGGRELLRVLGRRIASRLGRG